MDRRVQSLVLALSAISVFAGCSQSERTIAPKASAIVVADSLAPSLYSAAATSLTVGTTSSALDFSAFARSLTSRRATFRIATSNASILAAFDASKTIKAIAPGTAFLLVYGKSDMDSIRIRVTSATSTTLTLNAPSTSLNVGSSVQLSVTATNAGQVVTPPTVTWSTSNNAVLSVSAAGLAKGVSQGSAVVTASGLGVTASMTMNVASSVSSPATPSGPLPALGTGVALPQQPALLNFSYPAVTGKQWVVSTATAFQNALNGAARGDEIVLQAGATFIGNFVMPAKTGTAANGWIVIRSSSLSSLPAGVRVSASSGAYMPKVLSHNADAALKTAKGASGWWIAGLELSLASTSWVNYGILLLGDGSSAQNSLSSVASDLVVDRSYVHSTSTQQTSRCIALNSARTEVRDSYITECHGQGYDTQAIAGWNGPGPYRIFNNMLAGAGENILFGGVDPAIADLVPSDIEIRRNYIYTPASWKGVWTKKNLFELKNARRVLLEGNVLDGSWADGQTGFGVLLISANQAGGCRYCRVTDITFRANLVQNVAGGFNISGGQTAVDTVTSRVALLSNVIEKVVYPSNNILLQVLSNGKDLTIDSLVAVGSGGLVRQFLVLDPNPAWTNMRFSNAVVEEGIYGLFSSYYASGEASLKVIAGNRLYGNVWIVGPQNSAYPTSTFVSSESLSPLSSSVRGRVAAATAGVAIP